MSGRPKQKHLQKPWHDVEVQDAMFDEMVGKLANGDNLVNLCRSNKDFPSPASFLRWVDDNPEYAKRYARAAQIRADVHAEKIVDVAETENNPAKARNIIDAIKWHNEKSSPKKYGAKILQESNVNVTNRIDLRAMSYGVRQELRNALMAQLNPPTIEHEDAS